VQNLELPVRIIMYQLSELYMSEKIIILKKT